ncbi:cilia- and flagella-associated protein 99-like, partial [Argonauta hians]
TNDTTYCRVFKECMCGCVRYWRVMSLILGYLFADCPELTRYERSSFIVVTYMYTFQLELLSLEFLLKIFDTFEKYSLCKYLMYLTDVDRLIYIVKHTTSTTYDNSFVLDSIITPLMKNAPRIAEYLKNIQIQLNMLIQKPSKDVICTAVKPFNLTKPALRKVPIPEPIPTQEKTKPIPKSVYQQPEEFKKLYEIKKNNKQESINTLKQVLNLNLPCAATQMSEKTHAKLKQIEEERNKKLQFDKKKAIDMPNFEFSKPVKMTKAAILREGRVHLNEEREIINWLEELEKGGKEDREFVKWQKSMKKQDVKDSTLEVEKLRLKAKLARQEAILAKDQLLEENRAAATQQRQQTEQQQQETLQKQKEYEEYAKRMIQEVSQVHKMAKESVKKIQEEKKKNAQELLQEKQNLLEMAVERAEAEMVKKMEIIERIRVITAAQHVKQKKMFDNTETSGIGLLSEMSLAELQERLAFMKKWELEDKEKKRQEIKMSKEASNNLVADTLDIILKYRNQKATMARRDKKKVIEDKAVSEPQNEEIMKLQRILKEKQQQTAKKQQLKLPRSKSLTPLSQEGRNILGKKMLTFEKSGDPRVKFTTRN